jgi:signal transduction histidine kinase
LEDQIATTRIAENKAQESQALTSAIARNFPKGAIVVFNADYDLIYAEGEELTRIDLKISDLEATHIDEVSIFSKEQVERIKEGVRTTLKGHHLSFEIDYRGASYSVNSTPLYSERREIIWAMFVYNNITEQKQVQHELAKALATEQELNELKSRFISMASHEFRTPLSAILSSAILIGKHNEPGKEAQREKHLSRIRRGVNNLVVILNDFLSLSKLEEGKIRARPKRFELVKFSGLMIDEMESSLKEGQKIVLRTDAKEIFLYQDEKLLGHILMNLISNASKYSDEGQEIFLEISRPSKEVILKVTDLGMGIPESEQQRLFERFFRATNALNIQGTGLGLNIVKQYSELMKGTVSFKSKEVKGSTFTVQLPPNLEHHEKNTIDRRQ